MRNLILIYESFCQCIQFAIIAFMDQQTRVHRPLEDTMECNTKLCNYESSAKLWQQQIMFCHIGKRALLQITVKALV